MIPFRAHAAIAAVFLTAAATAAPAAPAAEQENPDAVSYYHDVRPIFQANCQGCHQPAKAKGNYVMTEFGRLLAGGDEGPAIEPGDPEASYLVHEITPDADGEAAMPNKKAPLAGADREVIRRWIAEGAVDDTPENARQRFSPENPPLYERPPVVTALAYSPDGSLLAVSGYHEVLLHRADGSGLAGRLIGLSERIEALAFSPDGKRLAVAGGLPARMGEVQIWDVAEGELELSVPVTADTLYGVSWSPDGARVAFGGADTAVRVVEVPGGNEIFFNAAHDDWALDTVFSHGGSRLVSVGRDQTVKAYEVGTQRFIDNITSITPGALKGGIHAVARHPQRDEVLVGGADGIPQIFRLDRIAKRVIGDNSNLVRRLPALDGRIFDVAFSPDGNRAAAVSALDGHGTIALYHTHYDSAVSDELKGIFGKVAGSQSAEERQKVDAYQTADVALAHRLPVPECAVYSLAYAPDGATLAAGGGDGLVRFIDPDSGSVKATLQPAPLEPEAAPAPAAAAAAETAPALEVSPDEIVLAGRFAKVQLVVTATGDGGARRDVTREVEFDAAGPGVEVSASGLVRGTAEGAGTLTVRLGTAGAAVPFRVSGLDDQTPPDYIRDVNPIITKMGCNAGTCHGAKDGKAGFKLSLRGYDTAYDIRAFTDDHAARRINLADPANSLMLLKATAAVPHEGGQRTKLGEDYYEIVRGWIAAGAKVDPASARVESITLTPQNPVAQREGESQQLRVVARYPDGSARDVTAESFIESGNLEIAETDGGGLVTALRRGEAPVLARYEGAYAATTLTVMGDREEFVWEEPESWGEIDRLVAAKWERTKTLPSELCSDTTFVRRIHLDLTGLPPTPENVEAFLADARPSREKRDALIDSLVGSPAYVEHWTNKWADLLQVNRKFLGEEGAVAFRGWIRSQVAENVPYPTFVERILTAEGSNRENPAASYFKILRTPDDTMENTTHLFLATRFNCNKCHDHPFERWTQDQYYEMAAFFARVDLKRDDESGERTVGGTAVEGAKPLFEVVSDRNEGEVVHERTGTQTPPTFPYEASHDSADDATRRQKLAAWITSPDNPYFATSYVNRVWGYLLGTGIIEPLDDIRAGNPPSNPDLLAWLTDKFVESNFDVQELVRTITKSRVYQLSVETHRWNEDDTVNFSHAKAKRLPAEVLYDTIYAVTGTTSSIPGVPPGTRAAALPDVGVKLPDGFLGNLGRPARESACECERSNELQLGAVMALLSGPTVGDALSAPDNALAKLAASDLPPADLVEAIVMRVLNRPAQPSEVEAALAMFENLDDEHAVLTAELAAYKETIAPREDERAREREQRIADARDALAAYEKEIAPREAERDRQQAETVAALEADLTTYQDSLTPKIEEWAQAQAKTTGWFPLGVLDFAATNGSKATVLDDGSVVVEGAHGKGEYRFAADIEGATPITGIQLEMIPDERFPQRGPGRAGSGNFVLTELELAAAPKGAGGEPAPAPFARAAADFSQDNYDVATAIDGNQRANANNGWAIHPKAGERRVAVFELKQPVAHEGGTRLSFTFWQHYEDGQHSLGRFRVWATTSPAPVGLGLPQHVTDALAVAPAERTEDQSAAIRQIFLENDPGWQEKTKALADARMPRPEDPKLIDLRKRLASAEQPLAPDPELVRLQRATELSAQQLQNRRLTLAQDLTWALVNTPAFLFNH